MPRVDPYDGQYNHEYHPEYEMSTSGTVLFIGVIAAIIVAALMWASYNPQTGTGATNPPAMSSTQPATPRTPPMMLN